MPKYHRWLARMFAHRCALCDGFATEALCAPCWHSLPRLHNCCPQCALPLEHSEALCADCLAHPKAFARTYCSFPYTYPLNALVQQFKNRAYNPPMHALCDVLIADLTASAEGFTALVPMPQHWRGLLKRGRNPAAELAVYIGAKLNSPVENLLRKTRYSPPQKFLNRKERRRNLQGSFATCKPLEGGHFLLVDDVMTTCASAMLASEVLLAAGAARVDVAVLARTPDWRG